MEPAILIGAVQQIDGKSLGMTAEREKQLGHDVSFGSEEASERAMEEACKAIDKYDNLKSFLKEECPDLLNLDLALRRKVFLSMTQLNISPDSLSVGDQVQKMLESVVNNQDIPEQVRNNVCKQMELLSAMDDDEMGEILDNGWNIIDQAKQHENSQIREHAELMEQAILDCALQSRPGSRWER